ncbi:MAG: toxin-antitoxin system HicB family antitoxin [Blastocatellia bacterium]
MNNSITLNLPETLYCQMEALARSEGVSLIEYALYALTRQVTTGYRVVAVPEEDRERQRAEFVALLARNGKATKAEIRQALDERESIEPEPDLDPLAVARLQEMIAAKRAVEPA